MNMEFKNQLKLTLIALGIFLIVSLIFAYPALQGKVLNQHDNLQWQAMSWEAKQFHDSTGQIPLWTNSMFGGMPTYTFGMFGLNHPISTVQQMIMDVLPKSSYLFLFAMIGSYILLRTLKIRHLLAIVGGIVYAYGTYNVEISVVGHETKMYSVAFIPIALAGMIRLYRGEYVFGALLFLGGLSFTNQFAMFQMIYYQLLIMLALGIAFFIKTFQSKEWKKFAIATGLSVFLGLLSITPNVAGFALTQEYTKATMRGGQSELTLNKTEDKKNGGLDKDYAFRWSQGVGETFTLLVPNLYGGASSEAYWGDQPGVAGPIYFGVIIMLCMLLALSLVPNRMKWVLFGIGVFGCFMAMGKNFSMLNYFLFDNLPMYNKFRTPSMSMTIPAICFSVLGIWGLDAFFDTNVNSKLRFNALKISTAIVGGLVLLFLVGSSIFFSYKSPTTDAYILEQVTQQYKQQGASDIQAQQGAQSYLDESITKRKSATSSDSLRSLVFIVLAVLLLFFYHKGKLDKKIALFGTGALMCLDLFTLIPRYMNEEKYLDKSDYEAQFAPRPVDRQIQTDKDPYYRVMDLTRDVYNDAFQTIHHKCIGGYSPAKLENIQDLIEVQLSPGKMLNGQVLNMLNTKYIIYNPQQPQIIPNVTACGNAWFVSTIKKVKSADEEMLALNAPQFGEPDTMSNSFKPLQVAIVRERFLNQNSPSTFTKDSSAKITLTRYGLNDLVFKSSNNNDGFAVFSDMYYTPGWKATIDNKEVEIIKTNYLLRGLFVPKGEHTIEFHLMPETFVKTKSITYLGSSLILILMLAMGAYLIKNSLANKDKKIA